MVIEVQKCSDFRRQTIYGY